MKNLTWVVVVTLIAMTMISCVRVIYHCPEQSQVTIPMGVRG